MQKNRLKDQDICHGYLIYVILAIFSHLCEGSGLIRLNSNSSTNTTMDIFILSGQSNMSGRGGVHSIPLSDGIQNKRVWDGIVPPECEAEEGAILRLNEGLKWVEAHEPLHIDIDKGKVCGLGPGLVFAATLFRHLKSTNPSCLQTIGLVPCAIGGTEMKEWEKGSKLYENMIDRTKVALSNGGSLKALLWYQGESDTYSRKNAKEFRHRLETLVSNIRSDLHYERLPIIQVGITASHHPHPDILKEIQEIQRSLNIPGVHYIDAKGLQLQGDHIHLSTDAQRTLGQMFFDTYIHKISQC